MIVETRHRLREWGKWAAGGDPSLASMFKAMFGRGGTDSSLMPPHIQEIDGIVCRGEPQDRVVLVQVYTRGGSISSKALILGIAKTTLINRLRQAEWYVNAELDSPVRNILQRTENAIFSLPRIRSVRYFTSSKPA